MCMAKRIKERRLAMKFTQEELALKLNLQKSAIAKYENGRVENIKRSVIENMANILECSPSYLMGWDKSLTINKDDFTNTEKQIIFEYRKSDDFTKALVLRALSIDQPKSTMKNGQKMA